MKQYIRLTESQLNDVIKEVVRQQIDYLLEYDDPRNKFVDKCSNLFKQILENWCLCRYCTLTSTDVNQCHHHWRHELHTHLDAILNMSIKKNNSVETRYKAIVEGFEKAKAFNGVEFYYNQVKAKFNDEKINPKDKNIMQAASDFCNEINNIVGMLARANKAEIYDYAFSI